MTTETTDRPPRSRDDTNPFGTPVPFRRRRRRAWLLLVPALALLAFAGYGILRRPRPAVEARPAGVPPPASRPLTLVDAQAAVSEINGFEETAYRHGQNLAELLARYRGLKGTALVGLDLAAPTDASERIRQQAAALEKDPERARLLAAMQPPLAEIGRLRLRIARREADLGASRTVRAGETHSQIAREYLAEVRRLPAAEVAERLNRTPLLDPLLPGNRVWNLWLNEGFYSFVTQGAAPLPPSEALRQAQLRQRGEKEAALRLLNSMHYRVDRRDRLLASGMLSGGFLKTTQVDNLDPARFPQSIDLRTERAIAIRAAALGLKRIARVTVFPRGFQDGRDFRLRIGSGGRSASLRILIPGRFRGQRLVIAVE